MFSQPATVLHLGHTSRSTLSYLSWCVPIYRRVAQELFFSSECKLILKAGPSIQNTVLFPKSVLVLLVGIHMETDETYSLFLVNICPPISSFSHSFTCASVQESRSPSSFKLRFQHRFFLLESASSVETKES